MSKKKTKKSPKKIQGKEPHVVTVRSTLAQHVRRELAARYPFDGEKIRSPTAQREAMARDAGVSGTTIYEILKENRGTSIDNVARLANLFGCEPYELLMAPEED